MVGTKPVGVGVGVGGMGFKTIARYPLKSVLVGIDVLVGVVVGVGVTVGVGVVVGGGIALKSCPAALGGRLTTRVSGTKL
jgi:hypothetical protein